MPEIRSCEEVTFELIDAAFDPALEPHPAQRVLRLLERMARLAKPNAGAERMLLVLARLASADWIGGRLVVTLSDFGVATEIDVRVDNGGRPARWRSFSLAVPLAELSQWLRQFPDAVRPLSPFGEPRNDRVQLRAPLAGEGSERPPEPAAHEPVSSGPVSSKRSARPDVHRKQTVRLDSVQVPEEAFRKSRPPPGEVQRDTARPPAQPPKPAPAPTDPTDDGWD